jgi:hypothetical protein
MIETQSEGTSSGIRGAARFWEAGRLWYNGVLCTIVLLWLVFTWPHFRPALNLLALGKMTVLALLANACYCAAYLAEFFIQPLLSHVHWRRFRVAQWVLGMLLALVLENYWIADEIYPDFQQQAVGAGSSGGGSVIMASNMSFPAPLAVVGFLAACGGLFLALAAVLIFWFARKPKFARLAALALGIEAVVYLALLCGFSAGSHETALARGQEKYFCEIDCHLAYSIVNVKAEPAGDAKAYVITLRTRFDEMTISPHRPKGATLTPSPREVRLIGGNGREYAPVSAAGTPLMTPLTPGATYTTELEFKVPKDAGELRLLLNTAPAWPDHLLIGDENSWMHKKTYFAL